MDFCGLLCRPERHLTAISGEGNSPEYDPVPATKSAEMSHGGRHRTIQGKITEVIITIDHVDNIAFWQCFIYYVFRLSTCKRPTKSDLSLSYLHYEHGCCNDTL